MDAGNAGVVARPSTPILLFDDECAVCRRMAHWVRSVARNGIGERTIDVRPIGEDPEALRKLDPTLDIWKVYARSHLLMPDGTILVAGDGLVRLAAFHPRLRHAAFPAPARSRLRDPVGRPANLRLQELRGAGAVGSAVRLARQDAETAHWFEAICAPPPLHAVARGRRRRAAAARATSNLSCTATRVARQSVRQSRAPANASATARQRSPEASEASPPPRPRTAASMPT